MKGEASLTRLEHDLLESAYDSSPDGAWLGALAHGAGDVLEAHAGSYAYTYRITPPGIITLGSVAARAPDDDYWRTLFEWGARHTRSIARLYRTQVMTLGEALARARALELTLPDPGAQLRRHAVRDILVVMGQGRDGAGLILAAPTHDVITLSHAQRARLERLAAELAVAERVRTLRVALAPPLSAREDQVAALLRRGLPDKQIAHALGVSSSSVTEYTQRLRRKLECRPGEELLALAPSQGCPGFRRWLRARLTPAEHAVTCLLVSGASHAAIAHDRRSAPRTVASQLASVFRKAGVSGRRELVARWFGAPPSGK